MSTPPSNRIKTIAIVGISGRIGSHLASSLLSTGTHTLLALRHAGSKGAVPAGAKPIYVDYADSTSIVSALQNVDFLIITLSVRAPTDLHSKLLHAASAAGVKWVAPNIWGTDVFNANLLADSLMGPGMTKILRELEDLKLNWIVLVCGFWYEWSLALPEQWYGFTIAERKVTMYDDGMTRINTSTWLQCGRAFAAALALPVTRSGSDADAPAVLEDWKDGPLYISSFLISQRDMLDSLHRVLGTSDADWEIRYESTKKRVEDGKAEMQRGDMKGFAKAMYARTFFPGKGMGAEFEGEKGIANDRLGLPREELDEATRRAVEMVRSGWDPLRELAM